jgi:hypothetical protein
MSKGLNKIQFIVAEKSSKTDGTIFNGPHDNNAFEANYNILTFC